MKILLVTSFDRGGAGSAYLMLYSGLLQEDVDYIVLFKEKQNLNIIF